MRKIIFLILCFGLNYAYAHPHLASNPYKHNHSTYQIKEECRLEEVGEEFGSGLGFFTGGISGAFIATQIGIAGCTTTGWWTAGVGCIVSYVIGAGVGTYVGYTAGEKAGKVFCSE